MTPKCIKDVIDKIEWEGGLEGLVEYGVDGFCKKIERVDHDLALAIRTMADAIELVNSMLEKYVNE